MLQLDLDKKVYGISLCCYANWQVPLLLILSEKKVQFSFMFLFFVYLFPFTRFFQFIFRCSILQAFFIIFISLFHLDPANKIFCLFFCAYSWILCLYSRLILLFHEYIENLQSKMCLRAPYLT